MGLKNVNQPKGESVYRSLNFQTRRKTHQLVLWIPTVIQISYASYAIRNCRTFTIIVTVVRSFFRRTSIFVKVVTCRDILSVKYRCTHQIQNDMQHLTIWATFSKIVKVVVRVKTVLPVIFVVGVWVVLVDVIHGLLCVPDCAIW